MPEYHEFLYFRLAQEFDIRESRRDREAGDAPLRPFSAVRSELIVRPTTWSYIDLDATYDPNPESRSLAVFRARSGIKDHNDNDLSLSYTYLEHEAEYLSAMATVNIFDPVTLSYLYRYDFLEDRSLETMVGVEYRFQCWSIKLSFRDRLDDQEILVAFVLRGIGNVFGSGSGRESWKK